MTTKPVRKAVDRERLKLDYASYDGLTDHQKRVQITKLLQNSSFCVNLTPVTKSDIEDTIGSTVTGKVGGGVAIVSGIAYAKAYYDGTDKTGEIKAGQPVVFDTVTGDSVTGINTSWSPSEYRVVGISLVNFNKQAPYADSNENLIQIKLIEFDQSESGLIGCCLVDDHPGRGVLFDVHLGYWDYMNLVWVYTTSIGKAIDHRYGVPYPEKGATGLFEKRKSYSHGFIWECVSLDCESPGECVIQ